MIPAAAVSAPPAAAEIVCIGGIPFSRRRPLDGALGSELLRLGGSRREASRLPRRTDDLRRLHRAYQEAGAQWLSTHSFLAHATLDAAVTVFKAVGVARGAAGDLPVALSLGPGADDRSYGDLARAGADAGAALVLLETFTALTGAARAVRAAAGVGLPVVALLVFTDDARTLQGRDDAADAAGVLVDAGAKAVGANCQPPDSLRSVVARLAAALPSDIPVIARPSAGITVRYRETWRYPLTPAQWASGTDALRACGAALVGGCCGAGPSYISALAARMASAS